MTATVPTVNVKIHVTAVLQNPTGLYESTREVRAPQQLIDDPKFREAALAQCIQNELSNGALLRVIDENTMEAIPLLRIVNVTAVMDKLARVGLALV